LAFASAAGPAAGRRMSSERALRDLGGLDQCVGDVADANNVDAVTVAVLPSP